jgi:hypothetical protein
LPPPPAPPPGISRVDTQKLKPNNGANFESRPSNCYRRAVDFVRQEQLLAPASEVAARHSIPI